LARGEVVFCTVAAEDLPRRGQPCDAGRFWEADMSNAKTAAAWLVALTALAGCSSNGSQNGPPADGGSGAVDGTVAAGDGGLFHIDRSGLTNVGTTSALDYSNPNLWVCRPGIDSDPCYGDHGELDTTELLPDGGRQILKHTRAVDPKFDCFYVYPTVYLSGSGNQTDLSNDTYVLDALMAQGARMSELCEVYAPLYRQVVITPGAPTGGAGGSSDAGATLSPEGGGVAGLLAGSGAELALGDVRGAFKYYLDHFNNGRKFVLMGHSQGSGMLMGMMQMDVDTVPAVRSQMISALLLGGGATVTTGQTVGGTFVNIPICTSRAQTGCVVAYSSFDVMSPPGSNTLFGIAPNGQQTDCTEPGALNGNDGGVYKGSYFPTYIANSLLRPTIPTPDASTPYILYRNAFQGQCVNDAGLSYLQITDLVDASDPRGEPPYISTSAESLGFGLHLVDWNLPLEDLIDIVALQSGTALP
jgi:hypothetical protein